jgi:hypothetical protein
MKSPPSPLSSRPKRTRISCHAALDKAAYAPFRKEGRMKCDNATKSNRKSGVAQWRDLQFRGPVLEMFSRDSSQQPSLKVGKHSCSEQSGIGPGGGWDDIRLTRCEGLIDTRFSKPIDITQAPQFLEHPRRE